MPDHSSTYSELFLQLSFLNL